MLAVAVVALVRQQVPDNPEAQGWMTRIGSAQPAQKAVLQIITQVPGIAVLQVLLAAAHPVPSPDQSQALIAQARRRVPAAQRPMRSWAFYGPLFPYPP